MSKFPKKVPWGACPQIPLATVRFAHMRIVPTLMLFGPDYFKLACSGPDSYTKLNASCIVQVTDESNNSIIQSRYNLTERINEFSTTIIHLRQDLECFSSSIMCTYHSCILYVYVYVMYIQYRETSMIETVGMDLLQTLSTSLLVSVYYSWRYLIAQCKAVWGEPERQFWLNNTIALPKEEEEYSDRSPREYAYMAHLPY